MVIILVIGLPRACFKCFPQFTDCFVGIWVRVLLLSLALCLRSSSLDLWLLREQACATTLFLSFPVPGRVPFLAPLKTFLWEGILSCVCSKLGLGKCWLSYSSAVCAKGREWKLGVCGAFIFQPTIQLTSLFTTLPQRLCWRCAWLGSRESVPGLPRLEPGCSISSSLRQLCNSGTTVRPALWL